MQGRHNFSSFTREPFCQHSIDGESRNGVGGDEGSLVQQGTLLLQMHRQHQWRLAAPAAAAAEVTLAAGAATAASQATYI